MRVSRLRQYSLLICLAGGICACCGASSADEVIRFCFTSLGPPLEIVSDPDEIFLLPCPNQAAADESPSTSITRCSLCPPAVEEPGVTLGAPVEIDELEEDAAAMELTAR